MDKPMCSKHPWCEKVPGIERCTLCFERPKALSMDAGYTVTDWEAECVYGTDELDLKRLCDEMEALASWAFGKGVEAGVGHVLGCRKSGLTRLLARLKLFGRPH